MKVILDECVPVPLRHAIAGHEVVTSHYMGLGKLRDGALLDEIDGKYDVLITSPSFNPDRASASSPGTGAASPNVQLSTSRSARWRFSAASDILCLSGVAECHCPIHS
jgi:hypothetical protein